jgi:hypothetical protein
MTKGVLWTFGILQGISRGLSVVGSGILALISHEDELAAAGYSPHAAVKLPKVFQFLSRDAKPALRVGIRHLWNSPSGRPRMRSKSWLRGVKVRKIAGSTVDFVLHRHPWFQHLSI